MSCGGEDRAVVILQDLQPEGDVGGVIVADLRREFEIGAQECGPQLGDEFLVSVACVAPALATEFTIKAGLMLRPVNCLMTKRALKLFGIGESLNWRHL